MLNRTPASAPAPPSNSITTVDLLLITLIAAVLVWLSITTSRNHLLWLDETFSYTLLSDPSFLHMMKGWNGGVDSGGLFFYLLCRPWVELFGLSALSMRLFSTAGVIASMVLVWVAARYYFSTLAVAFAISLAYLTSPTILWQLRSGRFYGLFLAGAALAVLLLLKTAQEVRPSGLTYLMVALAHALLIGSHLLGLVYSAALLLGMVALDLLRKRFRPNLYGSALAGWVVIPISFHALVNTTSVVGKTFWAVKPGGLALLKGFWVYSPTIRRVSVVLVILTALAYVYRRRSQSSQLKVDRADLDRTPVYCVIACLVLAQLVIFFKSRFGISIYADRYVLPVSIATTLVLADLFTRLLGDRLSRRFSARLPTLALSLCLVAACSRVGWAAKAYETTYPAQDYARNFISQLPPEKTVVVTEVPIFTFFNIYDPAHHYIMLNDWSYDLDPRRSELDLAGHRFMANWKRSGFYADSIDSWEEVLATNQDFAVVVFPERSAWLKDRLLGDPTLSVRQVGTVNQWFAVTVFDVHRLSLPGQRPDQRPSGATTPSGSLH